MSHGVAGFGATASNVRIDVAGVHIHRFPLPAKTIPLSQVDRFDVLPGLTDTVVLFIKGGHAIRLPAVDVAQRPGAATELNNQLIDARRHAGSASNSVPILHSPRRLIKVVGVGCVLVIVAVVMTLLSPGPSPDSGMSWSDHVRLGLMFIIGGLFGVIAFRWIPAGSLFASTAGIRVFKIVASWAFVIFGALLVLWGLGQAVFG